ncbi:MAG TPA: ABC transporter substrate-binding protein, partial [Jatrophihabitans sp.]|nr:ABC transporter substrate-binding protein [Jatrophihabitans sp.]
GGTGGGGTGGSGGTGGDGTGGGGGTGGGVATGPLAGVHLGSCNGFKNTTGVSDSTITLANVADLSGPVPNLFRSAQAAVTAYVAYFNSTSSICGRKLKLVGLDSGTQESGDQQASQTACGEAFAMVGSMGAFDAGGASTVSHCGIPDIRAATTETARQQSPVTFSAYSLNTSEIPTDPFTYFKSHYGDAYKNAAFVYLNAGASSLNAKSFIAGEEKLGYDFKDQIAIDVTSVPNYDGIVTQLQDDGIKYVQYIGAYQYAIKLKSAMYQAHYNPTYVMDTVAYDQNYVAAGTPVDGTNLFASAPLFSEANRNSQLSTYLTWLQRTSGGTPNFFGIYAWAAAALFVQTAAELGGNLSRSAMVSKLRQVHGYTDRGMVPPQDVGGKHTPRCYSILKLQNGQWVRKTPYPYTCGSVVNSGVR